MTVKEYVEKYPDVRMELNYNGKTLTILDYGECESYGDYEVVDVIPDYGWSIDLLYIK